MAHYISPPLDEHHRLRTPLTEGEQRVLDFFIAHLCEEWEIYIQPHMNGLQPDFVLLHPEVGLAVFEVKDWVLNKGPHPYRMEKNNHGRFVLKVGQSAVIEGANPIHKINLYRDELFELYCPRLGESAGSKGFAAVSAGVIFPNSTGEELRGLFAPILNQDDELYLTLAGGDDLESGDLKSVFKEGGRRSSYLMNPELADDFRGWLEEPEYHREQRRPLLMNGRQKELTETRTVSGFRRVKGPAGSGKSLVVAARAAKLALEGKDVLVVCYNMTLVNYLRDLCARWKSQLKRREVVNKVTWIHFHQWCKRTCYELGARDDYKKFWSDRLGGSNDEDAQVGESVFDHELSEFVARVIDTQPDIVRKYDAILVDEGQDFLPGWWDVLRKVKKDDGEMLLVADASQDVYSKARNWTDEAMKGAGFPGGQWFQLSGSYRLPISFLPKLRAFAHHFLPTDLADIPELTQETFLEDLEGEFHLRWVSTEKPHQMKVCLDEILRLMSLNEGEVIPVPDITVLVSSTAEGLHLAKELNERNILTIDTFAEGWKVEKRKKITFYKGDARVKLTTVHSFKGIESRAMVICLAKGGTSDTAVAYTALTRLKRSEEKNRGSYLTVVSSHPEFNHFCRDWSDD